MLAITMRRENHKYSSGASEERDCLACDWLPFLKAALPGIPVLQTPNIGAEIIAYLGNFPNINGIIFSGGDDWGVYPERDETETAIFQLAQKNSWPVLGVCRGAQVINKLLGGVLRDDKSGLHVGARHVVSTTDNSPINLPDSLEVNSYHNKLITKNTLAAPLTPFALDGSGNVEGFWNGGAIYGIIWHPEREASPAALDINLLRHIFARKNK